MRQSGLAITRFHRRKHPRINLCLPVEYTLDSTADRKITRLGTIGGGGIMLYLPVAVPVGTAMELTIHLPGHVRLTCAARIVWTELLTGQERADFRTGVAFERIAEEDLNTLRNFIKEQQNPFDLPASFHHDDDAEPIA